MSVRKAAAIAFLGVAALGAAPLAAQSLSYVGEQTVDIAQAEEIEREALRVASATDKADKAAKLFRKAAALRPLGDPMVVYDLQTAGQLFYYAKDVRAARAVTRAAAEAAIATGDVVNAAHLLVDLVHLSIDLRDGRTARESHERAMLLATSPVLSSDERSFIELRLQTADQVTIAALGGQ